MPLFQSFRDNGCLVGIWKTEESCESLFAFFSVPDMYREEILALKTPERQAERLAVRVLLLKLLGEQKQIHYHPDGSPYLSDGSYHISISHTRGYVAVIVGKSNMIGIDIEQYGFRVHKVARKYMREDEIPASYNGSQTWSLLLHWSAKETMFKSLGREELDFRKHFRIYPFQPVETGTFRAQEFKTEFNYEYSIRYILHPDFVMTWVCG